MNPENLTQLFEPSYSIDLTDLREILAEILTYQEQKKTNSIALIQACKELDPEERFFHVEGDVIWKKDSWRASQERIRQQREESERYNNILDQRKCVLAQLQKGVMTTLDLDSETALMLALSLLKKKNIKGALSMGVDISELPELPTKHYILGPNGISLEL